MKFFHNIILISSCLFLNLVYPCGAQDILEPSHQLSCLCSMLHNQLPRNGVPNTVCSTWEIPFVEVGMNDLSASLPKHLYSMKADILSAYEYDPYLQLLLEYEHFLNYIFGLANHDSDVECRLEEHHSGILWPIQDGNSNCLSNGNSFGSLTYNKAKTFIETKVTAMKLQGFNL